MNQRSKSKELSYISKARTIGILLVIFGHSYPFNVEIPGVLDELRNFIYCFHMPLFIFISGYLVSKIRSIEKHGVKDYIRGRALRLLLPYVGLTILCFIPKILASSVINDSVQFSFTYFIRSLLVPRENVWGHFWFLPMIFLMGIISIGYQKVLDNNLYIAVLLLLLSGAIICLPTLTSWFGVEDIKKNLVWYLFGMVCGTWENFETSILKLRKWRSALLVIIGLLCFVILEDFYYLKILKTLVAVFMIIGLLGGQTHYRYLKTIFGKQLEKIVLLSILCHGHFRQ